MELKPVINTSAAVSSLDSDRALAEYAETLVRFRELHGPTLAASLREEIKQSLRSGGGVQIASLKQKILAPYQPKSRGLGYILSRLRTTE